MVSVRQSIIDWLAQQAQIFHIVMQAHLIPHLQLSSNDIPLVQDQDCAEPQHNQRLLIPDWYVPEAILRVHLLPPLSPCLLTWASHATGLLSG